MEDNLKILIVEYLRNVLSDLAQILNLSLCDQTKIEKEDDHAWKMTFNGRQPQNIDCGISQQPMIGSCSNFKLKLL